MTYSTYGTTGKMRTITKADRSFSEHILNIGMKPPQHAAGAVFTYPFLHRENIKKRAFSEEKARISGFK